MASENIGTEIPDELINLITEGNCVLFLGSGATREAKGPVGEELAELLADAFHKVDIPTNDLRNFSDILTSLVDREDVDQIVVNSLQKFRPSQAHLSLPSFCWKAIFTTNYDRLVEISYDTFSTVSERSALQRYQVVLNPRDQTPLYDSSTVCVYKLHGCIASISAGNPLVLTNQDYKSTRKKRQRLLRALKSLAREHAILFLGFSFSDQYLLDMLDEIEQESPYHHHRKMYLVVPDLTQSQISYFKTRNIEYIEATFGKFVEALVAQIAIEDRKKALKYGIPAVSNTKGEHVYLPSKLKVTLESQLEILKPDGRIKDSPREFLTGFPPELGDFRNRNDIIRDQENALTISVENALDSDEYLKPMIVVLGPGGAGKSTLATRVAYNIAEAGKAVSCRLKNPDYWKIEDIVDFAVRLDSSLILVGDGIEVRSWLRAVRELRRELSVARVNAVILLSCQKAVWNEHQRSIGDKGVELFNLEDCLSIDEAGSLVNKLIEAGLLQESGARKKEKQIKHIMDECEGHLVVALLELVHSGKFREIVIREYGNVSQRAQVAYQYIALLHQHRLPIPDYLLNAVSINDWNVFIDEVIRQEAELVIVQDMDSAHNRLRFRSRHPLIAQTIIRGY